MSIWDYFKPTIKLPNPEGPLKVEIRPSTIRAVNEKIFPTMESGLKNPAVFRRSREPYTKLTPEQKAVIGRRAAEHGITATIRHFSKRYDNMELKETTVRRLKKNYLSELKRKRAEPCEITELPPKLDKQVRAYLLSLRSCGAVVNRAITLACAEGIAVNEDASLLQINGGHISLTKHWAKNFLHRIGFVKRKGTTKAKVSVKNFEALKKQFLLNIKCTVEMNEIPPTLIINWDQTGIHYVPVSSWTMEKAGSKRIELVGIDDKQQLTAVFAGTLDGDFLPLQLVYKGKSTKCIPTAVKFPSDWDWSYSANHWSNEETMNKYFLKIILPYIVKKREELHLPQDHPALVIFDNFKAQFTEEFFKLIESHHVNYALVPANCTDRLQPLDLSVNKPAKNFLQNKFQGWYSQQVAAQLRDEKQEIQPVDLRLSVVKPLGAKWMIELFDHFKQQPQIIRNGFSAAGISDCLKVNN